MKKVALILFLLPLTGFAGNASQLIQATSPLSLSGGTMSIPQATGSVDGYLNHTDWTTFNGKQGPLTIGNLTGSSPLTVTGGTGAVIGSGVSLGVNTANLLGSGPISISGGTGVITGLSNATVSCATASGSVAGCLTSSDWATFNGKQAAGNYITALTGDVTATGPGSVAGSVAAIQGTAVSGVTGTGNVVFSTSPTISGASTSIKKGNCYLTNVESDIGNTGSAVTVDMSTANVFTLTLNAATPTITLTNYANNGCPTAFVITQDGTGSRVPSFSGPTVIWGNTGAHTLSTAAGAVDKMSCLYNGNISKLMCDLGTAYQ